MIVLCVPVVFWDSCRDSLAKYAPAAVIIPAEAADSPAWWREIKARWDDPDDLLLVEQDIAIHDQVIPQFGACRQPWCSFPFPRPNEDPPSLQERGLGCTRFTAKFRQMVTTADVEAGAGSCWECEGIKPGCFRHVEGRIGDAAGRAGMPGPHVHWPPVGHRDVHWPEGQPPRWQ